MKLQGFVLLSIFLNIFRSGYSLAVAPQNEMQFPGQRTFNGYYIPRDSDYKQGFTVFIGYFNNIDDPYPSKVCSGSIVTADYIIATAYCLLNDGLTTDGFLVHITGLLGTRYFRTITETYLHEDFDEALSNNIGIGKVNKPYDFTTGELFPVKLPHESWGPVRFTGQHLTVCGYRNTYTTENFYDYEPTCFIFTPRERDYCTDDQDLPVQDDEICASSSNMEKYSVCIQDFGAGLTYVKTGSGPPFKFYLYAIASYTVPYDSCGEKPTVFYVVSDALEWITSITGQ